MILIVMRMLIECIDIKLIYSIIASISFIDGLFIFFE